MLFKKKSSLKAKINQLLKNIKVFARECYLILARELNETSNT